MPKKVQIVGKDTTAIKISTEDKECLCIVITDHQVYLVADRHISKYPQSYFVLFRCIKCTFGELLTEHAKASKTWIYRVQTAQVKREL